MVVILEAMKMEMPVEAEAHAVVGEIRRQVGDVAREGDVLLVLRTS